MMIKIMENCFWNWHYIDMMRKLGEMRQLTTKTINGCILGSDADNSMHYFNQID